ncbi:MAG: GTP-binding protein, partial [Lachnospiraceae bacterium]|nr:GTP-binding protein [Lachnospiraceae bacterium]
MKTKVDVISGFLGAGKTTLIRKLLQEALKGEQVVLIENEFGEIGIDGGFLKDAGVQITEMSQGCICCTLVGDFGKALREVIATYHPDRVIIEPSGVGKLSDVMGAVKHVSEECDLELNSAATVADAKKCRIYMKNFGEFYDNQIENAGAIILSRTQDMTEEKLEEAVALLRAKNPKAPIITTPWDRLPGARILSAMEESQDLTLELMALAHAALSEEDFEEEGHHHHHHHDHDDEDEHEHHHHHHHDDNDDDDEHEHHHHHHDDDDDDDGHEHHHHHDDDDDDEAHEHHHHHHDDDE